MGWFSKLTERIKRLFGIKKEEEIVETEVPKSKEPVTTEIKIPKEEVKEEIVKPALQKKGGKTKEKTPAEESVEKYLKKLKQKRDVKEVEAQIKGAIKNYTNININTLDVYGRAKSMYQDILKGVVTDEKLLEDIITNREQLLRHRLVARIKLHQKGEVVGTIEIVGVLHEELSDIKSYWIGLGGYVPELFAAFKSNMEGTRIKDVKLIDAGKGGNVKVDEVSVDYSFA